MDPELGNLLIGIIIAGFSGMVIGNFTTSPIYRLPLRESLFLKDPYCGDCNAKLKPIDLIPVFSWLMTRGKCRYCGASVPAVYAGVEAIVGVLFVACFLRAGFSEPFLLVSFGMTALIMVAMMLYLDNFYSGKTVIAALAIGVVYRTLLEGTIYNAAGGIFAGLIVGGTVWRYSGRELIRDIVAFPSYVGLLCAAGVWLPLPYFLMACVVAAVASLLRKGRPWIVEWALIAYIILQTLVLMP